MTKLLLSASEAASELSISERTLWTLTKAGDVPSVKVGHRTLYPTGALQEWISAGCPAAGDAPDGGEDAG